MRSCVRRDVVILGGGLAGGFTAHAFASRGASVTLLESCHGLASKASGNRFALLTPYISTKPSPLECVYSAGFAFSSSWIARSAKLAPLLRRCGALQLPSTARLKAALSSSLPLFGSGIIQRVSSEDASQISGIPITSPAFHIAEAGFIEPAQAIEQLIHEYQSHISVHYYSRVVSITKVEDTWTIRCEGGTTYSASVVVLCNAYEASSIDLSSWLPLEPVRGQTVSALPSEKSSKLRAVLAFGGYLTPAVNGSHFIGAHYRHDDLNPNPSEADTADILSRCVEWLPNAQLQSTTTVGSRVCFRTSTIDRLPYVGALPDFFTMKRQAAMFRSGSDIQARVPLTHHDGLYVHVGHGSRGLLSCPVGAEIIARLAYNEELSELQEVAVTLTPDRLPYRLLV